MTVTQELLDTDTLTGVVAHDISRDPFPVTGWDAVVWAAGNATQSALYFQLAFGMRLEAYSGRRPATATTTPTCCGPGRSGSSSRARSARTARSPTTTGGTATASWTWRSRCPTWTSASRTPARPGRRIVTEPHDETDEHGTVRIAAIKAYGDTVHSLVDRSRYHGPYLPGYVGARQRRRPRRRPPSSRSTTWSATCELGDMDEWVAFYHRVMGFTNLAEFIGDDIATEYSALMSKVVASGDHRVKFPLNEPAVGKKKSQIDEYLEFYGGPGVQHLALATPDICATVDALRARGVEFLATPGLVLHRPGAAGPDRRRSGSRSRSCSPAASWSTATRTATCCRSSPSRSATGRRCSSSSSSGTARSASARATSRRCSRRSSASRSGAATC